MLNFLLIYINSLYLDLMLVFGPSLGTGVKLGLVNHVRSQYFFTVTTEFKKIK